MPKEQPTHSESEGDVKESNADLERPKASDSGESPIPDAPAMAESTATPSDSSKPISKSSSHSENQAKKPASQGHERTRSKSADVKLKAAPPASTQGSKPTAKPAQDSQDSTVGGSKIEAAFTQVWGIVSKVVGSVLSPIGTQLKASTFYSKVQPIVKITSFLWNQIIVPIGNRVIKPLWGLGLKFLRGRFPDVLKPFSDRFLTIVILGLVALIYGLFSSLIPPSQPAVQKQPLPAPVVKAPAPKSAPVTQPAPAPQPTPPVAEVPVEEPSPPEPEQKQIIEVQSQVAQVFDRYSQDIIQSVQANFQAERLVIKVSDRWFELSESEQNQLGTDVLERSRKLNFPKLEIRDQTDQLLAREPVVGNNIIVLQRRAIPVELTPDSPA